MTRCSLRLHDGDCRRPLGHAGACRPSYFDVPLCGAWMPQARERCARRRGHGWDHKTRYSGPTEIQRASQRAHKARKAAKDE